MIYSVYLIKNNISGKSYIGYTKRSVEERWNQHRSKALNENINISFHNAIRKYPPDSWDISTLEVFDSVEKAKKFEILSIKNYNTYLNGYNSTLGGDGNNGIAMSEESNRKRSEKLKGIPKNYDRMLGKKHSEETREKMRKPKKDKSAYQTEEFKEKMRGIQALSSRDRRCFTEESHKKMKNLIKEGITLKKISEILQISYGVVKKWHKRDWN